MGGAILNRLVIIGASGHGKVIADIAVKCGYQDIVFLDDNENVKECVGFPVVGKVSYAKNMEDDKIVAIGNAEIREKIQSKFDFKISLEEPYKLCDYKPAYGYIFEEFIRKCRE